MTYLNEIAATEIEVSLQDALRAIAISESMNLGYLRSHSNAWTFTDQDELEEFCTELDAVRIEYDLTDYDEDGHTINHFD